MSDEPDVHAVHAPFEYRLEHLAKRLKQPGPAKIIAIGSSSVAGEWERDIPPFPYRLQMWLRWKMQNQMQNPMIDVINRGKRGEDAQEQLARLQQDVIEEQPAMVIWQVGTNAVWKEKNLKDVRKAIAGWPGTVAAGAHGHRAHGS